MVRKCTNTAPATAITMALVTPASRRRLATLAPRDCDADLSSREALSFRPGIESRNNRATAIVTTARPQAVHRPQYSGILYRTLNPAVYFFHPNRTFWMIARKQMVTIPVAASPMRENGMPIKNANRPTNSTVMSIAGHRPNSIWASHTGRFGRSIFLIVGLRVSSAWRWAAIPIKATWPKLGTPDVPMNIDNPKKEIRFINRFVRIDCMDSEKKRWAATVRTRTGTTRPMIPFRECRMPIGQTWII